MSRNPYRVSLAIIGISLAISLALTLDLVPFLRGGFGWRWPYVPLDKSSTTRMLPAVAFLFLYVWGLGKLRDRAAYIYLLWVFGWSILLSVALLYVQGNPFYLLYTRTVSNLTTGAYTVGARFDSGLELLRAWPDLMMGGGLSGHSHMTLSPPSWPMLYTLAARLLSRFPAVSDTVGMSLRPLQCDDAAIMSHSNAQIASAWLGVLAPVWLALSILPLYVIGREIDGRKLARLSLAWFPIVPAASLFAGTLNSIFPLMATTAIALHVIGLKRFATRKWLARFMVFISGLLTGICLTISFVFVPLILLLALVSLTLYMPAWAQPRTGNIRRALMVGFFYGIGILVILLAYRLMAGYHLHELLPIALDSHFELERPYLPWLWLHVWDVALFLGLPAAGFFLLSLRVLPSGTQLRQLALAIALTLVIMTLSGTARGETGRVWMYFMPTMLLATAGSLERLPKTISRMAFLSQLLYFLLLAAVLRPVGSGLTPPPDYHDVRATVVPDSPFIPVNAVFSDQLTLIDFQSTFDRDTERLTIFLRWRAQRQMDLSYLFSILAINPDGQVAEVVEWLPLDFQYPTTCWLPEQTATEPVTDVVAIDLTGRADDGDWWLSLSVFQYEEGSGPIYLSVTQANGIVDPKQIGIGPVPINAS